LKATFTADWLLGFNSEMKQLKGLDSIEPSPAYDCDIRSAGHEIHRIHMITPLECVSHLNPFRFIFI
jgi:hypothetical protein